jgi:hypothetical protein
MTLGGLRAFFRTRLDGLGYTEWTDGFNIENIPSTVLDMSYHLAVGDIRSGPANQLLHVFDYPLTVSIFLKGFRDPAEAIDLGLDAGQEILEDILSPAQRLQTDGLKDIRPGSIAVRPLADSNDNTVVVEMEFRAVMAFCFA